ncbi:hypothetical protein PoB_001897100 [Plakobranchus ocellatus]|uniref:Uncharacterized protein n=1 Tax=Plakobranchus ocellatus TaxID=259542 RepID=A0AAV3YZG3_9GAST|nr:hypothetical protein PoB_001897100 [Plakobranchus ocellatus]
MIIMRRLNNAKDELKAHLRKTYSDPDRERPHDDIEDLIWQTAPEFKFNKPSTLDEILKHTSTPFGKKIGMLRWQTISTKYSPTWEKTSAKEVKEQVENGREYV